MSDKTKVKNGEKQINPALLLADLDELQKASGPPCLFADPQMANEALKEASLMPDPEYLYPVLVIEKELTILFADTGIGKTVFATQVGNRIAANGKRVLFLDLELSKKQFEKRYKDSFGNLFEFSPNFYRSELARLTEVPKDKPYHEIFIDSLTDLIDRFGFEVVIIDNLTKLSAGSTDDAKSTIPVLEAVNKLKIDKDLTIIAIEHSKKVAGVRPIELNDLQGSKMKANLCDSVFTIGRHTEDKSLRYIKQVKVRSAELIYDVENVLKCEITTEGGFLHFKELGYASEYEFIKQPTAQSREALTEQVRQLKLSGMSYRQIADSLGITHTRAERIYKKIVATEQPELAF